MHRAEHHHTEGASEVAEQEYFRGKADIIEDDEIDDMGDVTSANKDFFDILRSTDENFDVTGSAKADLIKWCSFPWEEPPFHYTWYGVELSACWTFMAKLGGIEKISYLVSEVEFEHQKELKLLAGEKMTQDDEIAEVERKYRLVDFSLNFLINSGVVGALLLSVLFPLVLTPLIYSDDSQEFFGDTNLIAFSYVYFFLMYFSLFCSIWLTFMTIHYYLHITIWMPTIDMKMWYVTELNTLQGISAITHMCIVGAMIALPFGIAVMISSEAAVISLLFLVIISIFLLVSLFHPKSGDAKLVKEFHGRIKSLLIEWDYIKAATPSLSTAL
jgi:hypothetical protein